MFLPKGSCDRSAFENTFRDKMAGSQCVGEMPAIGVHKDRELVRGVTLAHPPADEVRQDAAKRLPCEAPALSASGKYVARQAQAEFDQGL